MNQPIDYQVEVDKINRMSAEDIGYLMRFAPVGHPYMMDPYWKPLNERFQSLGGWTPQLSKHIGWN